MPLCTLVWAHCQREADLDGTRTISCVLTSFTRVSWSDAKVCPRSVVSGVASITLLELSRSGRPKAGVLQDGTSLLKVVAFGELAIKAEQGSRQTVKLCKRE